MKRDNVIPRGATIFAPKFQVAPPFMTDRMHAAVQRLGPSYVSQKVVFPQVTHSGFVVSWMCSRLSKLEAFAPKKVLVLNAQHRGKIARAASLRDEGRRGSLADVAKCSSPFGATLGVCNEDPCAELSSAGVGNIPSGGGGGGDQGGRSGQHGRQDASRRGGAGGETGRDLLMRRGSFEKEIYWAVCRSSPGARKGTVLKGFSLVDKTSSSSTGENSAQMAEAVSFAQAQRRIARIVGQSREGPLSHAAQRRVVDDALKGPSSLYCDHLTHVLQDGGFMAEIRRFCDEVSGRDCDY